MAMLAMDWAEDDTTAEPITERTRLENDGKGSLKNFDFVFLIQLSKVDSNILLEEVIIQQHSKLKSKKRSERSNCYGSTEKEGFAVV